MKIAMLVEYYYPYDRGGSEWSTHDLALSLKKSGQEVIIITPNYGAPSREVHEQLKIVRLPFYRKLKSKSTFLNPFWTNNLFWFVYSAYHLYSICKKGKVDVLHIQSKSFIVGAFIANLFLKKSLILTLRDYQVLCNLGFCLLKKTKKCTLFEYYFRDFPFFLKNYLERRNILVDILYFFPISRAKFMDYFVMFVAKMIKMKVCVSERQRQIFKSNGFSGIKVIYSSIIFPKVPRKHKKGNSILFVGKLSYAKGAEQFIKSIPQIIKETEDKLTFEIIGGGHLKNHLISLARRLGLESQVKFLGQKSHKQVLSYMAHAKILVVPSVWEEPFGRVVVESLSQNTPVVVFKKGAFPEIIRNGKYGLAITPKSSNIAMAVSQVLRNYPNFFLAMQRDWSAIKRQYTAIPADQYLYIYKKLQEKKARMVKVMLKLRLVKTSTRDGRLVSKISQ